MIRILYVAPSKTDSVSFYRGWGPLSRLMQQFPARYHVEYCTGVNWCELYPSDIIFLQRPSTPNYLQIIKMAKLHGKKVWIDYDDDLLNIPHGNPCYQAVDKAQTETCVLQSVKLADAVSVSTEAIAEGFGIKEKAYVIPNAYDTELFWYSREIQPPVTKTILWRGSATHDHDLMQYTEEMVEAGKKFPDYKWIFMGNPFWATIKRFEEEKIDHAIVKMQDPVYYFKAIWEMHPAFQIVPLADNKFNRAKSNIAWIEGTHAGALVTYPAFESWEVCSGNRYRSSPANFSAALQSAIAAPDKERESVVNHAKYTIAESLNLEDMNELRRNLISEIAE
jgi:hypothetical protein